MIKYGVSLSLICMGVVLMFFSNKIIPSGSSALMVTFGIFLTGTGLKILVNNGKK